MRDEPFYNRVSADRISSRQMDELIGIARGLCADGVLNTKEVEYLRNWLAANLHISDQPIIRLLFDRITAFLSDGNISDDEQRELFETLSSLSGAELELGEVLKPTSLPLSSPAPDLHFPDTRYTFTGTFRFGQRKDCVKAVYDRGGLAGSLTQKTEVLVIGFYATESWKHSSMGNKILKACELREEGYPISIVSEEHWITYL